MYNYINNGCMSLYHEVGGCYNGLINRKYIVYIFFSNKKGGAGHSKANYCLSSFFDPKRPTITV